MEIRKKLINDIENYSERKVYPCRLMKNRNYCSTTPLSIFIEKHFLEMEFLKLRATVHANK